MNKQEIIDKLNAQGTTFDLASTKAELEALLKSSSVPAGDAAAAPPVTDAAPDAGAAPPAADKPDETPAETQLETETETEILPESQIIEKVRAGLTREQAVEVINNQRAHDKLPALSAAELKAAGDDSGDIPEAEILAKTSAGLTRPQAIEVIHAQRAHDAARAV